jgi:hypothetical protein
MALQELEIDYNYFLKSKCSFEDLREASNQLSVSTQAQFDEIKNEKWFIRVFDMVTFSKKNEKRMGNQISHLAQAQQILMEILVRLSARDQNVSDLVTECFDKLQKLSQNDIALANKIKQLENSCILGISKQSDIADLSGVEREILGGLFYDLMDKFEMVSGDQRKYANGVLNYLDVEAQSINIRKSLESLNNLDVKKKIFICCLEYGFLNSCNFNYIDAFEDLITEFDFGNKTIKEIKNRILATYNLRGVNGFIDKYGYEDDDMDEAFFAEVESDVELEEDTVVEMTDLTINSILHIDEGETKYYSNRIVHINAYIYCKGQLEFNGCLVYYNESDSSDEITLEEGASLIFKNSKIVCKGKDEQPFIQAKGENEVILQNCELENCSYFINSNYNGKLLIDRCKLENPSVSFLDGSFESGMISNSLIHFSKQGEQTSPFFGDSIFKSYQNDSDFVVKECLIEGQEHRPFQENNLTLFNIEGAIFENCSFKNVSNCIYNAGEVSRSEFIECQNAIDITSIFNKDRNIENCKFEKCHQAIKAENTTIINCQFVECQNRIIETGISGNVSIEFCEFYNLFYTDEITLLDDACLYFTRMKGNDASYSTVKKCLFNGINLKEGFLIMGNVFEKLSGPTAYIEDCNFQNCVTNRSSGKIIKEYSSYFGLFNKQIEVKAIEIRNCKGLDKINLENGYTDDVIIKAKTSKGLKIGATIVATSVVGIPGLFAGKLIDMAIKDTDRHVE